MKRSAKESSSESTINTPLEELLTEHECARLTGRSVASLRRDRLLRTGCSWVKLGRLVRYRPRDVRAHIEENLHRATA
jgi:hypothetical protein